MWSYGSRVWPALCLHQQLGLSRSLFWCSCRCACIRCVGGAVRCRCAVLTCMPKQLKHTIKLDGHLEGAFLQWVKTAAIVVNWVIPILFLNGIVVKSQYATFELVSVPLDVAIWLLAMPMQIMGVSRFTTHGTWIPKFLYLFAWAADAVRLRTKYLMSEAQPDLAYFFILYCIAFGFLTLLLGATYFVQLDHFKAMDLLAQARRARAGSGDVELAAESTTVVTRERAGSKASTALDVNPEERASCVARWTFGWLTPLIRAGYKAPLQFAQIWSLPKRWASASVNLQFSAAWEQEQEAAKKATRPPSLVGAFRRSFGRYFASAGLYLFVQNLFQCVRLCVCGYCKPLRHATMHWFHLQVLAPGASPCGHRVRPRA